MKRRLRLKNKVKKTLAVIASAVIVTIVFINILSIGIQRIDDMYNQCDKENGYTCDYYNARTNR